MVADIAKKTVKPLPTKRLADGLLPPTNRWFSGLVFGDQPQPVFPLPLSFGLTAGGFSFGLPTVTASEKAILGGFKPDIAVQTGAKSTQISAYDSLTVTIDNLDGAGKVLGKTTLAQGSPFVRYTAETAGEIATKLAFTKTGDFWTAKAGATTYGLVVSDGSVQSGGEGGMVKLDQGGSATWFVVPADGAAEKLAELAGNPVTGSSVDYQINGEQVTTKLGYAAEGGTAFAAMPHQQKNLAGTTCDLGSYASAYGTLTLCSGNELSFTSPVSEPTSALDVDSLSGAEKKELADAVSKDIAGTKPFPADTYFGGKALYRAAMLLQLAEQLKLEAPATAMRAKLTAELDEVDRSAGMRQAGGLLFRLRRAGQGDRRAYSVLRVG